MSGVLHRKHSSEIKVLIEQTQQAKKKESLITTYIEKAKRTIDHKRRERLMMQGILNQLKKEFEEKKEMMGQMMILANKIQL